MSDEQETNQTGEGAWDASSAFSSNGSDAVDPTDGAELTEIDDRTQFLGDLARVMQSTVASEQTRNTELAEQRRKAHVDGIREREAEEIEELRELAKDDIKGIDAWSEGEIKRIKLERERRIASRREQLQTRLEEHRSVVGREVDAVEAAVANYRTEMEQFFGRLGGETDPIAIASLAGKQPVVPRPEGDRARSCSGDARLRLRRQRDPHPRRDDRRQLRQRGGRGRGRPVRHRRADRGRRAACGGSRRRRCDGRG